GPEPSESRCDKARRQARVEGRVLTDACTVAAVNVASRPGYERISCWTGNGDILEGGGLGARRGRYVVQRRAQRQTHTHRVPDPHPIGVQDDFSIISHLDPHGVEV